MKRAFFLVMIVALWAAVIYLYTIVPGEMSETKDSGQAVSAIQSFTFRASQMIRTQPLIAGLGVAVVTVLAFVLSAPPKRRD